MSWPFLVRDEGAVRASGSISMERREADRNLLFGMLALQRGFIGADSLCRALGSWARQKSRPLGELLVEQGSLTPELLGELQQALEAKLEACQRDDSLALATMGCDGSVREDLQRIADGEVQAAVSQLSANPGKPLGSHVATLVAEPAGKPAVGTHEPTLVLAPSAELPAGEQPVVDPDATLAGSQGSPTLPVPLSAGDASATLDHSSSAAGSLPSIPWVDELEATEPLPEGRSATVPSVSPDQPAEGLPGSSPPLVDPSCSPRYRILRTHAKGGLGEVFVALDEELGREVALKEIQRRHADRAESRLRFLLEAEVTGGLEHPGIVPVYGLGHYPDGRPYYAMRFIRGQTLDEAIDQFHHPEAADADPSTREFELHQLLRRFVDVCNAIAYAHSRGVLHRDLKPSNVMLGSFGETLVVDWGLAKALDRADIADPSPTGLLRPLSTSGIGKTLYGSAIGTPQYMSPEQAAGRLDQLGPQSDIYSLGATLYVLLTGKTPFVDLMLSAVLQRVRQGDFPRPRQVNPRIHPALEAICLKAMARLPDQRYASAQELGRDIERWLADEPVSAYREPFLMRTARWAKRHKTLVASAAVLLVTAVAALGIGTLLIKREQARTEANFRLARDAVDQMLTELGEVELADVPQMEPVRKKMLGKALEFYQTFLRDHAQDRGLRQETGRANLRLGNILEMLGDYDGSESAYQRAIALFGPMLARAPQNVGLQSDMASVLHNLGVLQKKSFQFDAAEKSLLEARRLRQRLVKLAPSDVDAERRLRETVYQLGTLLARLSGRHDEASAAYREAVQAERALSSAHPDSLEDKRKLARYLNNRGILLMLTDRHEAADDFQEALTIQEAQAAQTPTVAGLQWELARTTSNLGTVKELGQDFGGAIELYDRSLQILSRLAAGFPSVPDYRAELAAVHTNLGNALRKRERFSEAEQHLREAIALYSRLVEHFPRRPDYPQRNAEAYRKLGVLQTQGANPSLKEAEQTLQEGRRILEAVVNRYPRVPEYQNTLGMALENLARIPFTQHRTEEAQRCIEQAIKCRKTAFQARPGNVLYQSALREDYRNLEAVLAERRDYRRSAQAAAELVQLLPADPEAQLFAARLLSQAAILVRNETEMPEPERQERSRAYADSALEHLEQAAKLGFRQVRELDMPVFSPIQNRPEFQRLRQRLESRLKPAIG